METFYINNIKTTVFPTKQFKTISFFLVFQDEASIANKVKYSLLKRLLTSTSLDYPFRKQFKDKLASLYGAKISIDTQAFYHNLYICFKLELVDPSYLDQPDLIKEAISFLNEVIYRPNASNGAFNEKEFTEQKKRLFIDVANLYNNKQAYSVQRLMEIILKDEDLIITKNRFTAELENLSAQVLYEYYQTSILSKMRLFVVGDIAKNVLTNSFLDFPTSDIIKNYPTDFFSPKNNLEIVDFREEQNIKQSQLVIGYLSPVRYNSPNYYAMLVFNAMLGQIITSSLDTIIREKNSLAYNVYSYYKTEYGLLIIGAGIDRTNKDQVLSLVKQIIVNYQNGEVALDLLNAAKKLLINDLLISFNTTYGYYEQIFWHEIAERPLIKDIIVLIEKIELADIISVSKEIKMDTIYFLEGVNDEKN